MSEEQLPIKGWYYVEVLGSDVNKVVWEVIDPKEQSDIGLWGFDVQIRGC